MSGWKLREQISFALLAIILGAVLGLCIYGLTNAIQKWRAPQVTDSITENERAAYVAGVVMGLDLALASRGAQPMDKDRWIKLVEGFDSVTADCKDMTCLMERTIKLRDQIREKMHQQQGIQVF